MTPEGRIKELVKQVLKRAGAYYHLPVLNGMGAPSLDFIVCINGRFVAIETKAPGKKPTQRQLLTMDAMRAAGAWVFVVDGDDSLARLDATLALLGE